MQWEFARVCKSTAELSSPSDITCKDTFGQTIKLALAILRGSMKREYYYMPLSECRHTNTEKLKVCFYLLFRMCC